VICLLFHTTLFIFGLTPYFDKVGNLPIGSSVKNDAGFFGFHISIFFLLQNTILPANNRILSSGCCGGGEGWGYIS